MSPGMDGEVIPDVEHGLKVANDTEAKVDDIGGTIPDCQKWGF